MNCFHNVTISPTKKPTIVLNSNSFDMNLERFGVDTTVLKLATSKRIFRAWVEDWEKPLLNTNDIIAEVRLLDKYKDLVFYDHNNECVYTVWHKNLEWQRGRNGGWCLIGCPEDDKLDDEPFSIAEIFISLIAKSGQDSNVDVVLNKKES